MIRRRITIINKLGLHARAAAKLVSTASRFESDIKVINGSKEVNGKSILGVMMLAAAKNTELEFTANGPDEAEALDALQDLVGRYFDEGE